MKWYGDRTGGGGNTCRRPLAVLRQHRREVLREHVRLQRGAHHDEAGPRLARKQGLLHEEQDEIHVQRPLVHLVHNDAAWGGGPRVWSGLHALRCAAAVLRWKPTPHLT